MKTIPATKTILLFTIFFWSAVNLPVQAAEWPPEARAQMETAGEHLSAATTTAERVAALRELESIATAYPEASEARLTAKLMAEKATQEAGPAKMLAAIGELAAVNGVTDVETLGSIVTPLLSAIAEMHDNGTLMPEMAIQVDAGIKKLDDIAAKANLPSIAEAVDKATGDTGLAGTLAHVIDVIADVAKNSKGSPNLREMDMKATKEYLEDWRDAFLAGGFSPAISGPAAEVFLDSLVWNSEMFKESTNALDLVSEAIETGRFDDQAYARIEGRLTELGENGPWGSSTALDFFEKLCEKIPIAGLWCSDAFDLVQDLIGDVDCGKIDCDCYNVSGGMMKGPLIIQCEINEQDLVMACQEQGKIVGTCMPNASGPAAFPK